MTDSDEQPVTESDLGTSDGHRTRWGSPYGPDAAAILVWILLLGLFAVGVMGP